MPSGSEMNATNKGQPSVWESLLCQAVTESTKDNNFGIGFGKEKSDPTKVLLVETSQNDF